MLDIRLDGKVAIVTGGGTGIGRAICLAFAQAGVDVVVIARRPGPIAETAQEVIKLGRKAMSISCDVTKPQDMSRMVEQVVGQFGHIDILVNNAGTMKLAPAIEMTEADWSCVLNNNLTGTFLCSQAVARQMIKQRQGKIINIGSVVGQRVIPKMASYSVSKAGVLFLTSVLGIEWAKYNIQVNAVSPGKTQTRIIKDAGKENPLYDEETWLKTIPSRRDNRPEDVASAVLYLASPASDNIIGQAIIVDGGSSVLYPGSVLILDK